MKCPYNHPPGTVCPACSEYKEFPGPVADTAKLRQFARRFLDPEDQGYVVRPEVRDAAREALGLPRVES